MSTDYKSTIFLPKTEFQMKANLPSTEPAFIEFWQNEKIFEKTQKEQRDQVFFLHDGPPYANGKIHLGHALNKIIKDITVKFNILDGKKVFFVPGWDCHGLPIEKEVEKKYGKNISPTEIRELSRKYAQEFIEIQKKDFIRLGVFGSWDKPYITMSPDYEALIVSAINEIWKKGKIYDHFKPVFWCPHCVTALAEAEVEYKDKTSPSIYVLFPAKFSELKGKKFDNLFALVWTTTPWTIPGNFALAFGSSIKYVVAKRDSQNFIVAEKLKDALGECEIVLELNGQEFEGKVFSHPIFHRDSVGVIADFVSEEEGTGIVHIAPGHGDEDFSVGIKYNIPVVSVLDEFGKGTRDSMKYEGLFYEKINESVVEDLRSSGLLFKAGKYQHSYPHCWRCKNPIVFRATKQWFIKVSDIKEDLIREIEKVNWIPPEGKRRISSAVLSRPDWCISRQRFWGCPIPYVKCKSCSEYIWSDFVAQRIIKDTLDGDGSSWWRKPVYEFLPEGFKCSRCGGTEFEKGKDILDVWIDSGLSFLYASDVLKISDVADIYIEGTDQHRGWFQSSLILSYLLQGKAPYRSVFTHGFILDEFKRKMSKSLGNVVSPEDIIKEDGAEIVRIWSVYSDPSEDVKISEKILSEVKDIYRKVRNTIRFMLGVLGDNPQEKPKVFNEIDRYILFSTSEFEKEVLEDYKHMQYHKIVRRIHSFCDRTLSRIYLDVIKDTIYCDSKTSERRKGAQYAVFLILRSLIILISPIFSFLAEEAYQKIPEVFGFKKKKSVFLERFENNLVSSVLSKNELDITGISEFFKYSLEIREKINEIADSMRKSGKVGSSLELKAKVFVPPDLTRNIENQEKILEELFIISKVEIFSEKFDTDKSFVLEKYEDAVKCPRCWKYHEQKNNKDQLCKRCLEFVSM
ncbi:MAG: isoleucine--tRNA ligase [Candidatus Calescibacterium sp.]|nr:isoleucine--tRNA ligase [Candidatus Calescibacterium sp.]